MAMPASPGAGFVVIKAELVLSGFEAVLDSPAMAFQRHQLLHGRALGAPCGEEGQAAVGNVAADQKTPRWVRLPNNSGPLEHPLRYRT